MLTETDAPRSVRLAVSGSPKSTQPQHNMGFLTRFSCTLWALKTWRWTGKCWQSSPKQNPTALRRWCCSPSLKSSTLDRRTSHQSHRFIPRRNSSPISSRQRKTWSEYKPSGTPQTEREIERASRQRSSSLMCGWHFVFLDYCSIFSLVPSCDQKDTQHGNAGFFCDWSQKYEKRRDFMIVM